MATRYLVLRSAAPLDESALDRGHALNKTGAHGPADLSVEIVDGRESDAGVLRADPNTAAVVDAEVALCLIKPKTKTAGSIGQLKQAGTLRMPEGLLAVGAHVSPFSGQGVTVAVLDTGIDQTHPAFSGKQIVTRDFTGEGSSEQDVTDVDGHGTHCAGTICGGSVGDIRVGVAPGITRLCVAKVLGASGGTVEMLVKAMFWAIMEKKATVVSMSLGYDLPGNTARLLQRGVDPQLAVNVAMRQQSDLIKAISMLRSFLESQSTNVVFAAATGNESARPNFVLDAGLPGAELFPVGAVGRATSPPGDEWSVAEFSNGRAQVVAPGVDVISAAPGGGWASMSGTSMATPHVAGVAALWMEKLGAAGGLVVPDAVRSAIKASATRRPLVNSDVASVGAGLVQAPQ